MKQTNLKDHVKLSNNYWINNNNIKDGIQLDPDVLLICLPRNLNANNKVIFIVLGIFKIFCLLCVPKSECFETRTIFRGNKGIRINEFPRYVTFR